MKFRTTNYRYFVAPGSVKDSVIFYRINDLTKGNYFYSRNIEEKQMGYYNFSAKYLQECHNWVEISKAEALKITKLVP